MTSKLNLRLNQILSFYDSLDLSIEYVRRVAIKPLYDYCQILVYGVAVYYCDQNENAIKNCHLKTRWKMITSSILTIENPERWNSLIKKVHDNRSSVEHNDFKIPDKKDLDSVRKQIEDFKTWIISTGKEYKKKSSGFSFVQKFFELCRWYLVRAECIFSQCEETPPYSMKIDSLSSDVNDQYIELKLLTERLSERIQQIDDVNDIQHGDLTDLASLIKEIERIDAKENILLHFGKCSICGGNIVETQTSIGGNIDDPMPSAVTYRLGCENCDKTITEDTFDI